MRRGMMLRECSVSVLRIYKRGHLVEGTSQHSSSNVQGTQRAVLLLERQRAGARSCRHQRQEEEC